MSTIAGRYDATARAYQRWWGPVLEPTALRVLDALPSDLDGATTRLLDIGTGTGILAIEAARRWRSLEVTGIDGSSGMLEIARDEARRRLGRSAGRVTFATGLADRLPFPDASFDVAVSSFVFQLVPDRARALGEAYRVLRPGGTLAFVTWQVGRQGSTFAPDVAFYDALDELAIPEPESTEEARSGDLASATAAATQARRAGFRGVSARAAWLEHRHDPATYLAFLEEYAERETFEELDPGRRRAVRAATARRLARLDPAAFVWRAPVVFVVARRPLEG
jgi:SAM-dependent methyltransferase